MMILRSSPPSPFGRKVEIAASIVGLAKEIDVVAADTGDPNEILRRQNPLGKIPVLVLEDGTTIFDSRVIVEYLDMRAGGDVLIPAEPKARVKALTAAALADGILDAALLQIYEQRFRAPDARSQKWLAYHAEKVARGLATFAAAPPAGRRGGAHRPCLRRSAISICALMVLGGASIPRSSPGSMLSRRMYRPSRRPVSELENAGAWAMS